MTGQYEKFSDEFLEHSKIVCEESREGTLKIILMYLLNDIKKKPGSFKIGIFSIFLVIGFLAAI